MRLALQTRADHSLLRAAASSDGYRGIGARLVSAVRATIDAGQAVIGALVSRPPSSVVVLGTPAMPGRDTPEDNARCRSASRAEKLVYELLDAHADTAELASELRLEPQWAAHLDYLRALQRTGRETLAQMEQDR